MAVTDELRAMAVSVGLDMPQAATLMMGAADAIDRLDAENAKLFALLKHESEQTEKLRELIVGVHEALCTDKAGIFHKLIIASMEDDMRELGVEVN